jgi:hypothetical protein
VHLQQHAGGELRVAKASSMRIMARRMMSAAVPWIGALMAWRSTPARSCGFGERMPG